MISVSEVQTTAPKVYKSKLQEMTYTALCKLDIPFQRVDTDEVITMEDCIAINEKLDMEMVKTLFLCDRKQNNFYLFITAGDKPFSAKDFSNALGVSRLSFAPVEQMENKLGTKKGAATIFSALLDTAGPVKIVLDKVVTEQEWYGCSDGTTTGYIKIKTECIIHTFMLYTGHQHIILKV